MATLCIDIGGTRIKWAVIDASQIRKQTELRAIQVSSMLSDRWLNARLVGLVDPREPEAIVYPPRQMPPFDRIGISICDEVDPKTSELGNDLVNRGVPRDLRQQLCKVSRREVLLVNDGLAWIRGALAYARIARLSIKHPVFALILGTGAALGRTNGHGDAWAEEIDERFTANHLARVVELPAGFQYWSVHDVIGKPFFDEAARRQQACDAGRVSAEFTSRLAAVIQDIVAEFGAPSTLILGGGNARYVSVPDLSAALAGMHAVALTERELDGVNPDVIPLLGCLDTR